MIYDVIYIKSGTLSELTVTSYSDLADAKLAAEALVISTCKEVYISIRLGCYLPIAAWRPFIEDTLELENVVKNIK